MGSRELDEPSALRWTALRKGWVSLWFDGKWVGRGASLSAGSVSNCGGIFGWVLRVFFSGVWYGWYIL